MGGSLSLETPTRAQLKHVHNSPLCVSDFKELRRALKREAIREGGVSMSGFVRLASEIGIKDKSYMEDFFKIFDTYRDGWVDFKEFAMYFALVGRETRSLRVEYCYRPLDVDGAGHLDLDEYVGMFKSAARVVKRCNFALPGAPIKDRIPRLELTRDEEDLATRFAVSVFRQIIDRTKGGINGEVHFLEFIELYPELTMKHYPEVFEDFFRYFEAITLTLPATRKEVAKRAKGGADSLSESSDDEDEEALRRSLRPRIQNRDSVYPLPKDSSDEEDTKDSKKKKKKGKSGDTTDDSAGAKKKKKKGKSGDTTDDSAGAKKKKKKGTSGDTTTDDSAGSKKKNGGKAKKGSDDGASASGKKGKGAKKGGSTKGSAKGSTKGSTKGKKGGSEKAAKGKKGSTKGKKGGSTKGSTKDKKGGSEKAKGKKGSSKGSTKGSTKGKKGGAKAKSSAKGSTKGSTRGSAKGKKGGSTKPKKKSTK